MARTPLTVRPSVAESSTGPAPANTRLPLHQWIDSLQVLWAGAVLLFLLVGMAASLALYERHQLLTQEQREVAFTARLLESQTTRTFATISLAFEHLAKDLARSESASPALEHTLKALPGLRSLSLVDDHARVLASTRADNVGLVLDRRHLQVPDRPGSAHVGTWLPGQDLADVAGPANKAPSRSRGEEPAGKTGKSMVLLLQPLDSSGARATLLVGTLDPEYLAGQLLFSLDGIARQAALLDPHGVVLTATSGLGLAAGQRVHPSAAAMDLLTQHDYANFVGNGLAGEEVVAAFRTVRGQPLVMVVEQSIDSLMQHWQQQVRWLLAGMVVASAILGTLTLGIWRSLRHHERIQQALDAAHRQQARSEQSLRAMIEAAPAPMFVIGRDLRFLMINRAFEDFLGVDRHDILGPDARLPEPLQLLARHPRHDASLWSGSGRSHYLEHLVGADGSLREALVAKVALPADDSDDGDESGHVIGSITDVTEFSEAQRRIREARDVAEAAHRAKNEFITQLSHSLRTPLQTVLGYSELGHDQAGPQPELADMFGEIRSGAHSMLELVNDLLDLAKLESTAGTLRPARHDTLELVRQAAQTLAELAQRRHIQLRLPAPAHDGEAPLSTVALVDAARFVQAMRNMLENALLVSPPGCEIQLSWQRLGHGELQWTVRDPGPGIPRDELERIFEPFFQSSRTRNSSGDVGLGLAISHRIVAALGGRLWAENNKGEAGAQLHMTLPALH